MYLQSSRLRLRAPELEDLDYLIHVENDTREWMVSACKVPYSRFQLKQYIETNAHDLYVDKQLRLMIEHKETGSLVGVIDLFDFSPANHRAEMGLIIDRKFRGQAFGREALAMLCDYAEHVLDLHQLYAYILEENSVACRLYESSGFDLVVTLADWVCWDREYKAVSLFQRIFEK